MVIGRFNFYRGAVEQNQLVIKKGSPIDSKNDNYSPKKDFSNQRETRKNPSLFYQILMDVQMENQGKKPYIKK